MVCTFFGHRDTPEGVASRLCQAVRYLIEEKGVNHFYIGSEGGFDCMARRTLAQLHAEYPHIRYETVLAYLPSPGTPSDEHSLYPAEVAEAPPRFAIDRRNEWMLRRADYIVAYVTRSYGGAAKWVKKASRRGCTVLSLADE